MKGQEYDDDDDDDNDEDDDKEEEDEEEKAEEEEDEEEEEDDDGIGDGQAMSGTGFTYLFHVIDCRKVESADRFNDNTAAKDDDDEDNDDDDGVYEATWLPNVVNTFHNGRAGTVSVGVA